MKIILNNLLTFIHSFIHSFILTRTYSSVYWVQEQCIHTWFNLNCSSTVGVWHWVDYTPATQVRRRLRASSQRELIEADLNWNIDNLSDSSCSTIISGSEQCSLNSTICDLRLTVIPGPLHIWILQILYVITLRCNLTSGYFLIIFLSNVIKNFKYNGKSVIKHPIYRTI